METVPDWPTEAGNRNGTALGHKSRQDKVLAGEVGYHSHEFRLRGQPGFVFVAHLVSCSIPPHHERIPQRRGSPTVTGIGRKRPAEVALVEHLRNSTSGGHRAKPLESDDALPQLGEDSGGPVRQLGAAGDEACCWTDYRAAPAHEREGGGEVVLDDGNDPIKLRIAPVGVVGALR